LTDCNGGIAVSEKIVLYGAGKHGRKMLDYLKYQGLENRVYGFCDSNTRIIGTTIDNKPVIGYEEAKEKKFPFVITVSDEYSDEVEQILENDNVDYYRNLFEWEKIKLHMDSTVVNRDYCAFFHVDDMDAYFDEAEQQNSIDIFWGEKSPFYERFKRLDLRDVVELACGRGRHVNQYIDRAGRVTLVDILEKNISFCKERFKDRNNIIYYKNNGCDLSSLEDKSYTALFTYDAMVHFEMFDVYSYLKETYRILKDNGMALFHHSNLSLLYDQSFEKSGNPGGRNFMSRELFAYLANKAELEVIDQEIIDWSLPQMDCITLVRKNAMH